MPPSQTMREEKGSSAHCEVNRVLAAPASKLGINASMAFTLYNAPQSTCSQRVRFVLNAKALPFNEVKLNLLEGDQLKPDYLKLNPNGVVPTLDHDGAIIIDSTVITEYLDEVSQADSFTPEHPVERARMRAIMHFLDEMPAAAVHGCSARRSHLPILPRCLRWFAWTILACRSGRTCPVWRAGTIIFARIRPSSRPIITARC